MKVWEVFFLTWWFPSHWSQQTAMLHVARFCAALPFDLRSVKWLQEEEVDLLSFQGAPRWVDLESRTGTDGLAKLPCHRCAGMHFQHDPSKASFYWHHFYALLCWESYTVTNIFFSVKICVLCKTQLGIKVSQEKNIIWLQAKVFRRPSWGFVHDELASSRDPLLAHCLQTAVHLCSKLHQCLCADPDLGKVMFILPHKILMNVCKSKQKIS